jgi:hypothetical protein
VFWDARGVLVLDSDVRLFVILVVCWVRKEKTSNGIWGLGFCWMHDLIRELGCGVFLSAGIWAEMDDFLLDVCAR